MITKIIKTNGAAMFAENNNVKAHSIFPTTVPDQLEPIFDLP